MLNIPQICQMTAPLMDCADVIGLCLMGSYAAGDANELSDLDIGVFFEDEATALPEISWPFAHDLWIIDRNHREKWSRECGWQASAFLWARMLYDRDGRAEQYLQKIITAKEPSRALLAERWDDYLNGLYRSLKYHRKGVEHGHRACAAESVLRFCEALFWENGFVAPLPGRELVSMARLHLRVMPDDEQMVLLTQILRDGDPDTQAALFAHTEAFLIARGYQFLLDAWEGLIHLEIGRIAP